MEKYNRTAGKDEDPQPKRTGILESDVKDVAKRFWQYVNKDSKDTFLDADIKDVARGVYSFLNRDVVGKKVVLLEEEKLRTANVVARALKRKRSIIKTQREKENIARIKEIYRYLNNPFWQKSLMVGRSRKYLDKHLRRMTPTIVKGLAANVKKLEIYFNGIVLDTRILITEKTLKQLAAELGYNQFAICEKHQRPLVKDDSCDVLCLYTECSTGKCPFTASTAHGEEAVFLSSLEELFIELGLIRVEKRS